MQNSALNQCYLFLLFFVTGAIIGFIFDIFRIIRKTFKTSDIITYIEDILFWLISGFILLYSIFIFNNGEIRAFIFVAIILGIIMYILTLSNFFVIIGYKISNFMKTFILKIISISFNLVKKILYDPIKFFFINISKFSKIFQKQLFKNTKKGK